MSYRNLDPAECVAALLLLAVASGLMLIAQRRGWRPSLALAIYTAVVLRLVMLALAYHVQPQDFAFDFEHVGYRDLAPS